MSLVQREKTSVLIPRNRLAPVIVDDEDWIAPCQNAEFGFVSSATSFDARTLVNVPASAANAGMAPSTKTNKRYISFFIIDLDANILIYSGAERTTSRQTCAKMNLQQVGQLFNSSGHMSHTYRAMMRRPFRIPALQKFPRSHRKTIAAIGVSYLKNISRDTFAFRRQQLESRLRVFHHGEQRDRSMPHRHFDRSPRPTLP